MYFYSMKTVSAKNGTKPYSLLWAQEPTDQQLLDLVQGMLEEVKQKAAKANKKFKAEQVKQLKIAQDFWKKRHALTRED